jgi:preprotein translocase subunit SecY
LDFHLPNYRRDLEGRRSINRLTRFITLIWAVIQSVSLALYLKQILFDWNYNLAFEIVAAYDGAMIVLWLSELITDYGLGMVHHYLYIRILSQVYPISKIFVENSESFTLFSGWESLY